MTRRAIYRAWGWLIALSLVSTGLSRPEIWSNWPTASGILVLLLSWQKARIILGHYLGLAAAPPWRRGFNFALALLCLLLLSLYLVPLGVSG